MFYRRKVILGLLQIYGGSLEKIALQKLLFLFCNEQEVPTYSFVPFHYGSYSISANADLSAMARQEVLLEEASKFTKTERGDFISQLTIDDQNSLASIKTQFRNFSNNELMRFTYRNFAYFAINSKAAKNLLNKDEFELVEKARPRFDETGLFTIGYEGVSLEEYLNKLIRNDIKLLIDVRKNPVSMKFGFSKSTLRTFCEKLGIDYLHLPDVGIVSEYRQSLKVQDDYETLFAKYNSEILPQTLLTQKQILELLKKNRRIALTCFEADIKQCHRSHLANALIRLKGDAFDATLSHI